MRIREYMHAVSAQLMVDSLLWQSYCCRRMLWNHIFSFDELAVMMSECPVDADSAAADVECWAD